MRFDWLWQGVVTGVLATLVIIVGGVVVGVLRARESNMASPFLYGLIGTAFLTVIVCGFLGVRGVLRAQAARVTQTNIEAHIRDWTRAFDLDTQEMDKLEAPGARSALRVTLKSGVEVMVMQPDAMPQYIVIEAVHILAQDQRVTFEKLAPEQATQLLLELNIEMSRRGMHRKAQLPLTQVNLQRRLVISDDLTVDAFMVCLYEVESDKMLVRDVLALAMARLTRG